MVSSLCLHRALLLLASSLVLLSISSSAHDSDAIQAQAQRVASLTRPEGLSLRKQDCVAKGRLPRKDDVLRPLTWGELNFLHTTDIHGWYQGHRAWAPPEPNFSGDWGDVTSFIQHMRAKADLEGQDLLLVDSGDLHDGNGLSDGFPQLSPDDPGAEEAVDGHVSNKVFLMADYDLATIGNHELYNYSVALDVYRHFAPKWEGRYLTSNVLIELPDEETGEVRPRHIGATHWRTVTKHRKLHLTALGVLFNFKGSAKGLVVQDPKKMVTEEWFLDVVSSHNRTDVFVIAAHMPVSGDDSLDFIVGAIRKAHPKTPIVILGGHTHVRDCRMVDANALAIESGRYLETMGWVGLNRSATSIDGESKPNAHTSFSRTYIDVNARNLAFHAGLPGPSSLATEQGGFVKKVMARIADAWDLTHCHGIAPHSWYLERFPYGHDDSLLTLVSKSILDRVVRPAEPDRADKKSLILINSGSQRFDVHAGPFTANDKWIVSPFRDDFLSFPDVPWAVAKRLLAGLNEIGADWSDLTRTRDWGFIDDIFDAWAKSQWTLFSRRRPEAASAISAGSLEGEPRPASMGYVTKDSCPGGPGDDTVHTPIPFSSEQPDYVASYPSPVPTSDEEVVDVVFVDFLIPPLLVLLNRYEQQRGGKRRYEEEEAVRWGNVSTQDLYTRFAEMEWRDFDVLKTLEDEAEMEGYGAIPRELDALAPFVKASSMVISGARSSQSGICEASSTRAPQAAASSSSDGGFQGSPEGSAKQPSTPSQTRPTRTTSDTASAAAPSTTVDVPLTFSASEPTHDARTIGQIVFQVPRRK